MSEQHRSIYGMRATIGKQRIAQAKLTCFSKLACIPRSALRSKFLKAAAELARHC
jgi:hypothetical protein